MVLEMNDHHSPLYQAFQRRAKELGTGFTRITVYHGSPLKNWLSIMRSGLRNLSHSKFMLVGAVYGAGIYSSTIKATAQSYAQLHQTGGYSCVAECEVLVPINKAAASCATTGDDGFIRRANDFVIVLNEQQIRIVRVHIQRH